MRIGIFGGSFNPPHLGHLHLAQAVRETLHLDEVWLVPSKISPHRSMAAYAPEHDRLAMCRLAAEEFSWLRAEDYELRQEQISYTYYTVAHFTQERPQDEFFLLMGGDMLRSFRTWNRWEEILQRVTVAAVAREDGEDVLLEREAEILRQYGRIEVVHVESFPVSSTKIREMVKNSQDCSCYLPKKIVQYMKENHLYSRM